MDNGEDQNFVDVEEGLGAVGGEGRQDLIPQLFRRYEEEGLPQYPQAQARMHLPYMQQMPVYQQVAPWIKPRRSVVEIHRFCGEEKEDITEWLETWNRAVAANAWNQNEEKVMLPLYLQGRASQYYRSLPMQIKENSIFLKGELEKHFNSPSQRLQARHLLGERSQRQNETVADFYEDICKLVRRGWNNKSSDFQNEKALEYFVKGLKPTIKKIFWGEEAEFLDDAYQKARTRELYLQSKKTKFDVRAVETDFGLKGNSGQTSPMEKQMTALLDSMQAIMKNQETLIALQAQNFSQGPSSVAPSFRSRGTTERRPRRDIECWNCGEKGHFQNKCENQPKQRLPNSGNDTTDQD